MRGVLPGVGGAMMGGAQGWVRMLPTLGIADEGSGVLPTRAASSSC